LKRFCFRGAARDRGGGLSIRNSKGIRDDEKDDQGTCGGTFDPDPLSCLVDDVDTQISLLSATGPTDIDLQQGYVEETSVAASAPGALAIFGAALLAMGAMRRRAC
jgi:hypothetical protein